MPTCPKGGAKLAVDPGHYRLVEAPHCTDLVEHLDQLTEVRLTLFETQDVRVLKQLNKQVWFERIARITWIVVHKQRQRRPFSERGEVAHERRVGQRKVVRRNRD